MQVLSSQHAKHKCLAGYNEINIPYFLDTKVLGCDI